MGALIAAVHDAQSKRIGISIILRILNQTAGLKLPSKTDAVNCVVPHPGIQGHVARAQSHQETGNQ
jgi:hypothetical protein